MKKLLIIFASLLLAATIVITAVPWGLPQSKNFTYLRDSGDAIWAVENAIAYSYIYEIKDNTINKLYRLSKIHDGAIASVAAVSSVDGIPFVAQEIPEIGVCQVLSPDKSGKLSPVSHLSVEPNFSVIDVQVENNQGFLALLNDKGDIKVLESKDIVSDKWFVFLSQEAPAAGNVDEALFRDRTLYITLSDGQSLSVAPTVTKSVSVSEMPQTPKITSLEIPFSIRLACKFPIYIFALVVFVGLFIPLFIISFVSHRASRFSIRALVAMVGTLAILAFLFCAFLAYNAFFVLNIAIFPSLLLYLCISLILFIVINTVVVIILLRTSSHQISELSAQISRVAVGDYTVKDIPDRKDEIGEMYRSLQELCVSLSIRDYEVESAIRSYHRFVPCGLEQLLDRASVMEVSLGDSRAISGNAGIITVFNRQPVRHLLSDDDYVSFVNHTSSLMDSAIRNHDGLLLSSGYDMEGNKVYFRGDSASGIKSALDMLGAAALIPRGSTHPRPQFFVFLHKTVFLYGIAGSKDNMFPYLSSSELEFLSSYADPMRAAGVQIVMTEQFMELQAGSFLTRYIGFISSEDYQLSFKLYELLDSYSDIERNVRLSYDVQFQKAIALFYKSDYYLARNHFSSILRVCPTDGIARWYLFACEHFFNNSDDHEPNYQLFGVNFD